MYHCLVTDGVSFICMTEEALGRRIPFAFLDDVSQRFLGSYGSAREVRHVASVAGERSPRLPPVIASHLLQFYMYARSCCGLSAAEPPPTRV
jgi:hypothetical protein